MMKRSSLNLYKKQPIKEILSIVGIPFEDGSSAVGLRNAPDYLRKQGLVNRLKLSGIKVLDCGNIIIKQTKSDNKIVLKKSAIDMAVVVAKRVEDEILSGRRVLTLGGDHSISLGTITGASIAKGRDIGVIWIDAHPDICTWKESITKNIHGMIVSSLIGVDDKELIDISKKGAKIKKQNILYIGLKDMDDYEINFLKKEGISVVTMFDIIENGMGYVFDVVDKFSKKHKNIWVSMDMDSIQKQYAPSSPMATDEGFTAREILSLTRFIGRKSKVIGADIVEISSVGDIQNKTALLAIDIAAKLFGSDAGWYEGYMGNDLP